MKERIAAVFLFLLAIVTIWTLLNKCQSDHTVYGTLSEEVVRLHILADNDSETAQEIKLAVRDALLPCISDITASAADKAEALTLLSYHIPELTEAANRVLSDLGAGYTAGVSVTKLYFPVRLYGSTPHLTADSVIFPPGIYDSVQIILGDGAGHNWWCVAYPALCFTDSTYEYVPKYSHPYKKIFSKVKQSSLEQLFYGTSTKDAEETVDVYVEFKVFNTIKGWFKKNFLPK